MFVLAFEPLFFQYQPQSLQFLGLIRGNEMLSRNSQGFLGSLLSPAPTTSEVANFAQSQNYRDGSQESETEERAHVQDADCLEKKKEFIKKEEYTEDKKVLLKPSDIALKSAEFDEVWILLNRTNLFMLTAVEEDPSLWVYRPPLLLQYGPRSQLFKYWSKHLQHRAWFHW